MLIEFMRPLGEAKHPLSAAAWETAAAGIRTLFDITRRDLCFGGYAPWERETPPQ
jgi:hypothetical protein